MNTLSKGSFCINLRDSESLSMGTIFELMPPARHAHESLPDKIRRSVGILSYDEAEAIQSPAILLHQIVKLHHQLVNLTF